MTSFRIVAFNVKDLSVREILNPLPCKITGEQKDVHSYENNFGLAPIDRAAGQGLHSSMSQDWKAELTQTS